MTDNKIIDREATEILDTLEEAMVKYMKKLLGLSGREVTDKQAREVVSKIGLRIYYGKETFDKALNGK